MIDYATWQKANDEYLGTALALLRTRLEELTPPNRAEGIGWMTEEEGQAPSLWERLTGQEPTRTHVPTVVPLARVTSRPSGAATHKLVTALARLESGGAPPALVTLSQRLGLSAFERETLLLACAMELDTRIAALCARAQDDPARPYPTFALAMALFDTPSWDVLSPERPLRFWRLLEISQPTGQPLTASAIRADERIVNFVKGLNYLDDRLTPIVSPMPQAPLRLDLPESHAATVQRILDALQRGAASDSLPTVQLTGSDASTKELIASTVAGHLGLRLHRIGTDVIPSSATEAETLARLWDREAMLLPLALYIEEAGGDGGTGEGLATSAERFASRIRSVVFMSLRDARLGVGGGPRSDSIVVDAARPSLAEQRSAWSSLLGAEDRTTANRLAGQFDLSLRAIQQVAEQTQEQHAPDEASLGNEIWALCRLVTRPRLEQLAQRIDLRASWSDLVLPDEQLSTLRQLVAQVAQRARVYDEWGFGLRMNRGLGISALFAGESGTGKTMAAEVIAEELQLDLYRIDLSAVVSKYIGETEKNLRRVFDAAEAGGAILLFDEADALFGKRSEVKDSHDRYANIEINYLLQRLEAYRGLAVLTTNMKGAMDSAFLRRLRFVIDFPFPSVVDRKRMWRQAFPAQAELDALDFDRLARFSLTGGSVHNIALNAAFLAAHAGEAISMARVLEAARSEFRKLDRPVNEADFRLLTRPGAVA